MSRGRTPTRLGIAVGGVVGTVAALWFGPSCPDVSSPAAASGSALGPSPILSALPLAPSAEPDVASPQALSPERADAASAPGPLGDTPPSAAAQAAAALPGLPQTAGELRNAELWCDQRRNIDECLRAARAHELGSAGPIDSVQARRFQNITMTYAVRQCEGGLPHACFVLANRYESGTGVKASRRSAEALKKRALDLCRVRRAPECPPS